MTVFILAVSVALVVSFLCSIFESVLLTLGHADIEALEQQGHSSGRILKDFKNNIDIPIAAILVANTVAHTIGSSVAGASYGKVFEEDTLWIFTIVFTLAVLLLTEIIPKTLGVSKAKALATPVAYGIQFLTLILKPVVLVSERISRSLRGGEIAAVTSTEEIRLLASLGKSEGSVGQRTARMIVGATQLGKLTAKHVMVPRRKVAFLSSALSPAEVLEEIANSRHSRFPFSPTVEIDDISGIVLAKDILLAVQRGNNEDFDWKSLTLKPLTIPASKPLNDLLRSFQESHSHMALVVDEYGGFEGIVTLEDVLEEIVGEIIDESDHLPEKPEKHNDGSIEVSGGHELRRVITNLESMSTSDASTVGGLVFQQLGRLPVEGDEIEWNNFRFRVLSMRSREVDRIMISPAAAQPKDEHDPK